MTPAFFNDVEPIALVDPLAKALGTFDQGDVRITYTEIAKMAGHSCPTVAGAYMLTKVALQALFKEEVPSRDVIAVAFRAPQEEGVTGVMAQVMTNITGAAPEGGFKGIGGRFVRANRLRFNAPIEGMVQFTRLDTNEHVTLNYHPNRLPMGEALQKRMALMQQGEDVFDAQFGELWQERVREVLLHHETHQLISRVRA